MIKAIETVYNGYRFRSRLEARWAVFFDTLGIEYRYEPEGFDLGEAGWYLPDFWLPNMLNFWNCSPGWWIEIKGKKPSYDETERCAVLAQQTCNGVMLLWSNFSMETQRREMIFYKDASNIFHSKQGPVIFPMLCGWWVNPSPLHLDAVFEISQIENRLDVAFIAARQARFERGNR